MNNYRKYSNMSFNLEKMEDTKFNGEHPNGYNKGFKLNATIINLKLSEQHDSLFVHDGPDRWFHTSTVQSIEECVGYDLIHTMNSVYKLTPNFIAIPGVQEKYSLTLETDKEE